ncbi:cytochrome P450 [Nonomuraea sp. NPDC049607]|uniref:cytochrome P450 n=1 Tax=Nonomuraea sp. NPDC049607 TaxID=3154732 RepID=UPI003440DC99
MAAAEETLAYLTDLCAAKRADPADDLISAMVQMHDEGGRMSDTELVSTSWLLLVAGHETTVHLIGNGMRALLTHPGQPARLRSDPGLLPDAIEEFLRYDGPISTSTFRFTTEPVTIGGVDIPAGQLVVVSLLSANRDAAQYDDADRFRQLLGRFPALELAEAVVLLPTPVTGGPALPEALARLARFDGRTSRDAVTFGGVGGARSGDRTGRAEGHCCAARHRMNGAPHG